MNSQFQAAAKLTNEWRDTLFYTSIAGGAVAYYALTKNIETHLPFLMGAGREFCRGYSWATSTDDMCLIGRLRKPVNKLHFAFSGAVGGLIFLTLDYCMKEDIPHATWLTLITGAASIPAGGTFNVMDCYKTMWDWPRKRDDGGAGGTSQTGKIKGAFQDLARGLGRRLVASFPATDHLQFPLTMTTLVF